MQVCASEDAEGRSSAVPLMVSAQELKCMLFTAWERVTCSPFTWENLFPAFPPSRKQTDPPPPRKAKTHGCAACSRRGGVNLLPALSHSNRQRCEVASLALSPPLPPCSFKLDLWSCSLWLICIIPLFVELKLKPPSLRVGIKGLRPQLRGLTLGECGITARGSNCVDCGNNHVLFYV